MTSIGEMANRLTKCVSEFICRFESQGRTGDEGCQARLSKMLLVETDSGSASDRPVPECVRTDDVTTSVIHMLLRLVDRTQSGGCLAIDEHGDFEPGELQFLMAPFRPIAERLLNVVPSAHDYEEQIRSAIGCIATECIWELGDAGFMERVSRGVRVPAIVLDRFENDAHGLRVAGTAGPTASPIDDGIVVSHSSSGQIVPGEVVSPDGKQAGCALPEQTSNLQH